MQCHRGVNISSGGYGYWPGSLPGITASRWTFPVVDAVTPKAPGYIESKPSGSARDRGPGTMTGTEFHPLGPMPGPVTGYSAPACWPHSIYGYRAVCPEHYPFIVTTITARVCTGLTRRVMVNYMDDPPMHGYCKILHIFPIDI